MNSKLEALLDPILVIKGMEDVFDQHNEEIDEMQDLNAKTGFRRKWKYPCPEIVNV